MPALSVIIPAYNEEQRLPSTIKEIKAYLDSKKYDYEIIVVDDGSNDNSVGVVKQLNLSKVKLLVHEINRGKGAAVKTGMLAGKGEYLLFTDADHSTPIEELEKFMQYIKQYDIIIGSRSIKGAKLEKRQPLYRMFIGKIFNKLVRLITVKGLIDTQCGFKLFTGKCARQIFAKQTLDRWSFDVEILYIARKYGYKILELPVRWVNRRESRVDPLKDSLRMLRDLFVIRWNDVRGRYD
ncbi:MAG: glycosyltransferase family 2 protein [Candidatus Aenigmarchaeota archaeon]|nr:glycosyltransferase family 2 protein [Candidatus Aenigmarchaeota archaeon]